MVGLNPHLFLDAKAPPTTKPVAQFTYPADAIAEREARCSTAMSSATMINANRYVTAIDTGAAIRGSIERLHTW